MLLVDFKEEYKVLKLVGKGNFSKVYKVRKNSTGEIFAAKIFQKHQFLGEDKGLEGIYNEVKVLRQLGQNQSIMNFCEIYETKKLFVIVTEFIYGKQLLKRISN